MARQNTRTDVATDLIVSLYRTGLTTYEVADRVGVCQATVVNRLKQARERRRTRWEHYATMPPSEAIELYRGGLKLRQVAKLAGVTHAAIKAKVKAAGIAIRPAKATPRLGPDHHGWKGGRFKGRGGYIWIHTGRAKSYRPEHRMLMEQQLKRPLKEHEIVHHLNGVRDDNRLDNLVVTTLKEHEHYTYVKRLQARIRELESFIRRTP